MNIKKGDIIKAECSKTAFKGKGIVKYRFEGTDKDFIFFVDDLVEGDIAEIQLTKIKTSYGEAKLINLISPSSLRIKPKCPHFETSNYQRACGGCKWQNIPYEKQLEWKQSHVEETIHHLGGFKDFQVSPIIGCEKNFYYRNKMEYSFGDTKERDPALGLHIAKRRYDLVNVTDCHLQGEDPQKLLNAIREYLFKEEFYNLDIFESLYIRNTFKTNQLMLNLVSTREIDDQLFVEKFINLINSVELSNHKVVSIYITHKDRERGRKTVETEKLVFGQKYIVEKLNVDSVELSFEIGPFAFFQPNPLQAEVLYENAIKLACLSKTDIVYDLYCGTGTIGMSVAHAVSHVYGIEINSEAILVANKNAKQNNIENISFYEGDTKEMIGKIQQKPTVIILDPPRAGLDESVIEYISSLKTPKLVYVSCNPSTFARDLKLFEGQGYKLKVVQPVDMFPQTYHIENIGLLERA